MTTMLSNSDLFYNLDDESKGWPQQLASGLRSRVFAGEHVMLSIVTVAPNTQGQLHSHPEEQWGILIEGEGVRTQGGKEFAVKARDFWRTPGGVSHTFKAGPSGARLLDIFSPPRADYTALGHGALRKV